MVLPEVKEGQRTQVLLAGVAWQQVLQLTQHTPPRLLLLRCVLHIGDDIASVNEATSRQT